MARKRERPDPSAYDDEFSKRAIKALKYLPDEGTLRDTLKRLDQQIEDSTLRERRGFSTLFRRPPSWLNAAAAVPLILVFIFALVFFQERQDPYDHLFSVYFEPVGSAVPLTGALRLEQGAGDLKMEAFKAYESDDFDRATRQFRAYLEKRPDDREVAFYYGIALMSAGRQREAIPYFTRVFEEPPGKHYRQAAAWYLALAHLKNGNLQEATAHFQQLAGQSESPYYRKNAAALLRDLPGQ